MVNPSAEDEYLTLLKIKLSKMSEVDVARLLIKHQIEAIDEAIERVMEDILMFDGLGG